MIDLHCHVLAGIDDGPETIAGSLELARIAADLGTRTIVATPHVSWHYTNDSATIARLVQETSTAIRAAGVALELIPGAEVAMTRVPELAASELKALTLGDGPWLLLECPFSSVSLGFDTAVFELEEQGYRIVLAHPERCQGFHRDPEMLEELIRGGVLASVTAGSLIGSFGERVRRFALGLVEAELVHNIASDAHDSEKRPPSIAAEMERAGLGALAEWMTEAVPGAILAGEARIPPRPSVSVAIDAGAHESWWQRGPLRRA